MKTFLVIGMGRFGKAVATELCALGNEVMAMDVREDLIQSVSSEVTYAVTADAKDQDTLRELGVDSFECAVVAIGHDVGTSALITLNLKELGVDKVIAKASSHTHRKVLEKIGADRVVFPEHEMGNKLAHALSSAHVLNFIELSEEASIVEIPVPQDWAGKTLRQLDMRKTHRVNVISLRRGSNSLLDFNPDPDEPLQAGDVVTVLGLDRDIDRVQKL